MSKIIIGLILASVITSGWASHPPSEVRYFGFAVIDCGWDDPLDDEAKTNYVDEISGFANVGHAPILSPR